MINKRDKMKQTNELTVNTLRRLALMQHLGEDFFIVGNTAYEGDKDEVENEWKEECKIAEDSDDTIYSFDDYCIHNCTEVEELEDDDYSIDYMILTDEEADEKWEESLDNYIEECITPEIDKLSEGAGNLSYYITFDEESWKRDARMDGRGHSLSSYDGHENEETIEGTTFYIYRTN
jgi:hypothetical protein